jgi:hypothetical protein
MKIVSRVIKKQKNYLHLLHLSLFYIPHRQMLFLLLQSKRNNLNGEKSALSLHLSLQIKIMAQPSQTKVIV